MVTAKGNSPRVAGIPSTILDEEEAKTLSSPQIRENAANNQNDCNSFVIFHEK